MRQDLSSEDAVREEEWMRKREREREIEQKSNVSKSNVLDRERERERRCVVREIETIIES